MNPSQYSVRNQKPKQPKLDGKITEGKEQRRNVVDRLRGVIFHLGLRTGERRLPRIL